jgi:hypothetical protein
VKLRFSQGTPTFPQELQYAASSIASQRHDAISVRRALREMRHTFVTQSARRARGSLIPYRLECRPNIFPSVSMTSEVKPYCPMENFFLWIRPPDVITRPSSTEQSSQAK